jgi:acetylornithine deacetylase/succinyl-diaminopimelate desuccinylase-like protein
MALSFDLARAIREALSYDTRTPAGSRALVSYLMDLLDYGEFRIIEQAAAFSGSDNTNLVGLRGPGGPGGLLLSSAVLPSPTTVAAQWTETEEDPLNATERDGLLFGLGAAGNRVDLVARVLAASQIPPEKIRRPLAIVGLFGDDARVGGAMHLIDSGVCAPEMAVVSDATNLELVRAHRGYVVMAISLPLGPPSPPPAGPMWRIDVAGESAHSAEPEVGRNAVARALTAAMALRRSGASVYDLDGGDVSERVPRHACLLVRMPDGRIPPVNHALLERVATAGVACLDGALAAWERVGPRLHALMRWSAPLDEDDFVPAGPLAMLQRAAVVDGALRIDIELRTRPGEQIEALTRDVEAAVRRLAGEGATVEITRSLLPFRASPSSPLVDIARGALSGLNVPAVIGSARGHTEAWVYGGIGIDTLVFGPGTLAARNRPNEHAILRQVMVAQAFYSRVIMAVCG